MNFCGTYFGQKYYRIKYKISSLGKIVDSKDRDMAVTDDSIEIPHDTEFKIDCTNTINTTNLETDILCDSYIYALNLAGSLNGALRAGKTINYYPHFSKVDSTFGPSRKRCNPDISLYDLL